MINVIYIPEVAEDARRLAALRQQAEQYLCGGRYLWNLFPGVFPSQWPQGGRLKDIQGVCASINSRNGYNASSWWQGVMFGNPQVDIAQGRGHHVGCAGSHLGLWWTSQSSQSKSVFVVESDGGPLHFADGTGGCPGDFLGVAKAAVEQAPSGWHIIHMDKGTSGAEVGTISRELNVDGASGRYRLHPFPCRGVAGLASYLVSKRFLDELHVTVARHNVGMVDAWLCHLCNVGILSCYSVAATTKELACPKGNVSQTQV